jgi:type I restriction enzyme S subunit
LRSSGNNSFLFQFLDARKDWVTATYLQGGQGNLSGEIVKSIVLGFPSTAEQQKIADCLTSLDEVIAAQGRKVEALKAHKKGLMQQLFPREGETLPRLRFPEFRDSPEWEAKRIVDLNPFVTSGSRGWAEYYAGHGSIFVRITNLSRESIYLDLTDSKYVNLPPEATEGVRTQLKLHDVLISVTADIGMIGYIDEAVPSPAYINQHIALARFDPKSVSGKFVAYYLASDEAQSRFRAATDNGTKAGMNLSAVQNLSLQLPSPAEQQRIAACLTALDARIAAESAKVNALKLHKKGLMQQLFPSPDDA